MGMKGISWLHQSAPRPEAMSQTCLSSLCCAVFCVPQSSLLSFPDFPAWMQHHQGRLEQLLRAPFGHFQLESDGVHGLVLSWQHPAGQDGGGLSIPCCWSLSLMPCARRSGDAAAQRGRICGRWEQMAFAPLKAKLSLLSGGKVMFSSLQGSSLSLVWCSWLPWGIKERVLLLLLISVGCPGSC